MVALSSRDQLNRNMFLSCHVVRAGEFGLREVGSAISSRISPLTRGITAAVEPPHRSHPVTHQTSSELHVNTACSGPPGKGTHFTTRI